MIFHRILDSNVKTNEVAEGGGGAGGEREARCQRAPPCRRSLQPVKSPVHAGPALEAARTVQLFSPQKVPFYFETLQHVRSSEIHL